jgi:thiol:disulfide interchange protein DsbA
MFKKITYFTLIMFLSFFSLASNANEQGYETISPAQPTQNADKVEVIEFFWYGCPHCYAFEPLLEKWAKNLPKNVEFIRQPAAFNETWSKHAKAYFTAEALGVVDKVHADFFDAIQNKKLDLDTEASLAKFFAEHGINETQFHEAYNSFIVDTKMRQAPLLAAKYGITGVPALIVNGKYRINGTLAGSHENMIVVLNKLIAQESGKK